MYRSGGFHVKVMLHYTSTMHVLYSSELTEVIVGITIMVSEISRVKSRVYANLIGIKYRVCTIQLELHIEQVPTAVIFQYMVASNQYIMMARKHTEDGHSSKVGGNRSYQNRMFFPCK